MCAPKTPKVKEPTKEPVEVLHNPLLDGSAGVNGLRIGRQMLRSDAPRSPNATAAAGIVAPSVIPRPTTGSLVQGAVLRSLKIKR